MFIASIDISLAYLLLRISKHFYNKYSLVLSKISTISTTCFTQNPGQEVEERKLVIALPFPLTVVKI